MVHHNHTKEFYALLTNEMPHWKKVEKQVGKDEEVSPPYFFRYSFFTFQK
ncbi:MAG: M48 family metallopeptidase [Bacteroidales bacterium]|nr:M48 family metallopeptidase [Bacteroidales bacterium]